MEVQGAITYVRAFPLNFISVGLESSGDEMRLSISVASGLAKRSEKWFLPRIGLQRLQQMCQQPKNCLRDFHFKAPV